MRPSRSVRLLSGDATAAKVRSIQSTDGLHRTKSVRLASDDWDCVCVCGWHSRGGSALEAGRAGKSHIGEHKPKKATQFGGAARPVGDSSESADQITKAERRRRKQRQIQEDSLKQRLVESAREMGITRVVLMRRRLAALDAGWAVQAILSGRAFEADGTVAIPPSPKAVDE